MIPHSLVLPTLTPPPPSTLTRSTPTQPPYLNLPHQFQSTSVHSVHPTRSSDQHHPLKTHRFIYLPTNPPPILIAYHTHPHYHHPTSHIPIPIPIIPHPTSHIPHLPPTLHNMRRDRLSPSETKEQIFENITSAISRIFDNRSGKE